MKVLGRSSLRSVGAPKNAHGYFWAATVRRWRNMTPARHWLRRQRLWNLADWLEKR
jgi:hypothetical protein